MPIFFYGIMNLTDRINKFHERYIFPFSNGVARPYFYLTATRVFSYQAARAKERDINQKAFVDNLEFDTTQFLHFFGCVAGVQLLQALMEKNGSKTLIAMVAANGGSYVYERLRERYSAKTPTGTD